MRAPAERDDPRQALSREAQDLWRLARSVSIHPRGCGCCGGGAIQPNPEWLAEDVDHLLRTRYAAKGSGALVQLLDAHPHRPNEDLGSRIGALVGHEGSDAEVEYVLRDLVEVLASIAEIAPSRRG